MACPTGSLPCWDRDENRSGCWRSGLDPSRCPAAPASGWPVSSWWPRSRWPSRTGGGGLGRSPCGSSRRLTTSTTAPAATPSGSTPGRARPAWSTGPCAARAAGPTTPCCAGRPEPRGGKTPADRTRRPRPAPLAPRPAALVLGSWPGRCSGLGFGFRSCGVGSCPFGLSSGCFFVHGCIHLLDDGAPAVARACLLLAWRESANPRPVGRVQLSSGSGTTSSGRCAMRSGLWVAAAMVAGRPWEARAPRRRARAEPRRGRGPRRSTGTCPMATSTTRGT